MDFHPTSNKNDQNHPNQEPRALNPISIAYLKALTSIFCLLMRVSYFYRLAESEKKSFWLFFQNKMTRITHNRSHRALNPIAKSLLEGPDIRLLAAEASLLLL
jgi:hypothetical protein